MDDSMGADAATSPAWQDRLAYFAIGSTAKAQLKSVGPILGEMLPALLDDLYANAQKWPRLREKLGDAASIERLKEGQVSLWRRLFSGDLDEGYVEEVREVVQAHARIGLDPTWHIGSWSFILSWITERMTPQYRKKPDDLSGMLQAVSRAIFLDMDIMIEVHNQQARLREEARMAARTETFEAGTRKIIEGLAAAAAQVQSSAETMVSTAGRTKERAGTVAEASADTTANVQSVASAAEQLTQSIKEIAVQVNKAQEVSAQAVRHAETSNASIQGLTAAGEKIGEVVSMINDVAAQTNLLALNATIEAARAGEAGKGFAVVAAEVKALANQTAEATKEIGTQITAMQEQINGSAEAIDMIGRIIGEVSEVSTTIAAAVEEQDAATHEIARGVNTVANETQGVSKNVSDVIGAADMTDSAARQLLDASGELSRQGAVLKEEVEAFLSEIRAA
jgi:methyl-accepting chemotaxis protein